MIRADKTSIELLSTAVFVYVVIIHAVAEQSEHYACGPNFVCDCFKELSTIDTVTMDCSMKQLANLSEICDNLGNATRLDASSNNITGHLNNIDVNGCENLVFLSLRNNTVSDIKRSLFKKLDNLRHLDLSNNTLPIYTNNSALLFADLFNLETLKINGNPVNYSTSSPRYPDLTANKHLTSLYTDGLRNDNRPFPALTSLDTLVFSGFGGTCDIESIYDHSYAALPHLRILNMSSCNLSEISLHAFSALRNLERLDLSSNRGLGFEPLINISYGLQFTKIKFLNMSYVYNTFGESVRVTKENICFLKNTTLQELALDGNRIELFKTNSLLLFPSSLQTVHINDNHFTFSPYQLQITCLSGLLHMYANSQSSFHDPRLYSREPRTTKQFVDSKIVCPFMTDDFLNKISQNISGCSFFEDEDNIQVFAPSLPAKLKTINVSSSNINTPVNRLLIMPLINDIERIDVSGNVFFELDGPVGPLFKLQYLDLSRTYCSVIKGNFFEYAPALENLQLHSNIIGLSLNSAYTTTVFQNLTHLNILNLTLNKINSIHPETFVGLPNLTTLDLSYNNINILILDVRTLTNLTHVNLRNNALESLPVDLLQHVLGVSRRLNTNFTINLRQNTLKYGCQTKDFLSWMVDHKESFVGFSEYVFVDDNGDPVTDDIETRVKELEKKCQSNVVWIVISCIGVSVAVSVILFGIVYRNRWKLRYFMYMTKQRFYGYVRIPNEEPVENYKYDAFISYSEENLRFVKDQLIPRIEHNGVSLCVHQRDFLPGNAIADNIVDAIQSSRKTVVLLTKAFLKRKWCMYEFNMARMETIYSRDDRRCLVVAMLEEGPTKDMPLEMLRDDRGCLVVAMLEEVPAKDMPLEMLRFIQTESYIEYTAEPEGQVVFWDQLKTTITT